MYNVRCLCRKSSQGAHSHTSLQSASAHGKVCQSLFPFLHRTLPAARCPLLVLITSLCLCLFGRCDFVSVCWKHKVMCHYVLAREFLNFYGRQTKKWSTMTQRITSPFFLLGHVPHCVLKLIKRHLKKVKQDVNIGSLRLGEDPTTQALAASVLKGYWISEIITMMKICLVWSIAYF